MVNTDGYTVIALNCYFRTCLVSMLWHSQTTHASVCVFVSDSQRGCVAKLSFSCPMKGHYCLYGKSSFSLFSRQPHLWIQIMLLTLQVTVSMCVYVTCNEGCNYILAEAWQWLMICWNQQQFYCWKSLCLHYTEGHSLCIDWLHNCRRTPWIAKPSFNNLQLGVSVNMFRFFLIV